MMRAIFSNINVLIVATDQTLAIVMSDCASLEMRFKIGVLKELHRRQLLSKGELDGAIKAVEGQTRR